jgi:hypothetical protein
MSGNNDVFPDYQIPLGPSELLSTEYQMWDKASWLNTGNENTFTQGGYYSYNYNSGLKIIGLNTVRWII